MRADVIAWAAVMAALIPCGLFLVNLCYYRLLPRDAAVIAGGVSVLIPARNEEDRIRACLESVLANPVEEMEVLVLDDQSTDRTREVVAEMASRDPRVRVLQGASLPSGWCGKQYACYQLARMARFPWLVFLDADVRLAPDALSRMIRFASRRGVALASGVPRQIVGSHLEKLLVPLVHFILLGFLPLVLMRWTRWPGFSAGCGQLFVVARSAYFQCGGHALVRQTLHDGVQLPRAFRRAGHATDLFDATDVARCRMFSGSREAWFGLGRNAHEGLGHPRVIGPMTLLLVAGQILPVTLLVLAPWLPSGAILPAAIGATLSYMPRLLAAAKFRQPWSVVWLHPVAVAMLLWLQWRGLWNCLVGRPSEWRGRRCTTSFSVAGVKTS